MTTGRKSALDYRVLFEKSQGCLAILDPHFNILAATDEYCRATLTPRGAMVGRSIFKVFPDNPDDPLADGETNLRASLQRVLSLRRLDPMTIQRYDMRNADGSFVEKYWSPMNLPVLNDDGSVRWIVHRVNDLTDTVREGDTEHARKRLARERLPVVRALRAANRELAELENLPEQLIQLSRLNSIALMCASIVHDMRQPLTAAKTYVAALRRLPLSSERKRTSVEGELLDKVDRQLQRSIKIVQGLRGFLTGTRTPARPDDLSEIVGEAVVLADFAIRQRGIKISRAIGKLPPVEVERTQIQQVIVNLVINAVEAMTDGAGHTVRIAAAHVPGEDFVRVCVADDGPGLTADVAARVFQPFTSTKSAGMGLGLSICREIVQAHGGRIWAAPNQPRGTVFNFTLPMAHPGRQADGTSTKFVDTRS